MHALRALTSSQMKRVDALTVSRFGIPVLVLMENAGRAVAEATRKLIRGKRIVVLCGSGHNGGDGVVAARYLHDWGYKVKVWWVKNPQEWEGDVAQHYQIAKRLGVSFESFARIPQTHRVSRLRQSNLLIDALLGTGTRGEIRGLYRDAIEAINQSHRPVVAVDIPSGLDSDRGLALGIAVKAKVTVTMAAAKTGLLKPAARPYVGRLIVADIGIPHALLS
jgi:hydroxyethylthiazole kinase-like uncharacterized protein yjeF